MSITAMDARLQRILEESTCFGIGHDPNVKECKMCDVREQCKAKTQGMNVPTPTRKKPEDVAPAKEKPTTKKTTAKKSTAKEEKKETAPKAKETKAKPKSKPKKAKAPENPNLPNFKEMSFEELVELAKERNVEWKDYNSPNITRMRLIMALKASY
ncbi:late gene regulatory protein [Bacillus phage CampHawk]|uniref:Late gene regulatory protein n=1 Tax=Bacillus phage CampHawk TaxID=1406783 RepID=U5PX40_9CAUD|nr:late gene regulatory protein [Bacillus phage CampHawk]AGY47003.1 late gene regulatory protein [Bacillus phage CampHawk]